MSTQLKLSNKQANFLFINLFAHDPSHDFNPGANAKRLARLNALADRLFDSSSPSFNVDEIHLKGGVPPHSDDEIDTEILDILKYDGFEETGIFFSLANTSCIKNLCENAGLDVSGIINNVSNRTRNQIPKIRQFVEFVQTVCEYNKLKCLNVQGLDGIDLPNPYADNVLPSGGYKHLKSMEPSSINLKSPAKPSRSETIELFLTQLTNIFDTIKNEIKIYQYDSDLIKYKSKLLYIYGKLKQAILFYHNYVDAFLPIYSILNTFFIEETLFICSLDTIFEPKYTYFRIEDTNEDIYNKFKYIYELHTTPRNMPHVERSVPTSMPTIIHTKNIPTGAPTSLYTKKTVQSTPTSIPTVTRAPLPTSAPTSPITLASTAPTTLPTTVPITVPTTLPITVSNKPRLDYRGGIGKKAVNNKDAKGNMNKNTISNTQRGGTTPIQLFQTFIEQHFTNNKFVEDQKKKYNEFMRNSNSVNILNNIDTEIIKKYTKFFNDNTQLDTNKLQTINQKLSKKIASEKVKCISILTEYRNNYNLASSHKNPRQTRLNQIKINFENEISRFYKSVTSYLLKEIKANNIVLSYNEQTNKPTTMSPKARDVSNKILKILCRGILDYTRSQYRTLINNSSNDGFEHLYKMERTLLLDIANNGTVPSKLDSSLIDKFNELIRKNYSQNFIENIGNHYASQKLQSLYDTPKTLYVINNAMTTPGSRSNVKIVDELTDKSKNKILILCPISSVIDAQGTMGSCTKGYQSVNYISDPIDIIITKDIEDAINFEIYINTIQKENQGKKRNTILTYYAMYDQLYMSDITINAVISDGVITILSANNTYKSLLDHIELKFLETKSTNTDWRIFDTKKNLEEIVRVASKKMMGDFLQELNAILPNGGFTSPVAAYNNSRILLTNGDRPSTVRAAYLLLHKDSSGINPNAAVTFITTSNGFLYRKKRLFQGGNKKKLGYRRSYKAKKRTKPKINKNK